MSISAQPQLQVHTPYAQPQFGQVQQTPVGQGYTQPGIGQQPQLYGMQAQMPYGQPQFGQQPYGQAQYAHPQYGQQLPYGLTPLGQVPQPFALGQVGAQVVSDIVLRVVSACLATVLEQLRIDPSAQQSLAAQGQLTPQAYSSVLAESARRCAPIVAAAFAQLTAGSHQQIFGQTPQPGLPWSQTPQLGQTPPVGQAPLRGQQSPYGQIPAFGQQQQPFGQPQPFGQIPLPGPQFGASW